jgi:molybdopterin-containing oxidoreductase family iron-sulfur binding subunit
VEVGRRGFLKLAGLIAVGASVKPVIDILAPGQAATDLDAAEAHPAEKLAMVVNPRALPERYTECFQACHRVHNVPEIDNPRHEVKWIWAVHFEGAFPEQAHEFSEQYMHDIPIPVLCNHCTNAPCVRVCPTRATWKRKDGIVMMDYHRCIGCRFCMAACPYGARSFNWKDPRPHVKEITPGYPTRTKGVVEKCNFCADLLAKGQQPACVEACPEALVFGNLEDPDSQVRGLLASNYAIRRKPGLGTQPNVYYLL